jgi:hypothetical protein
MAESDAVAVAVEPGGVLAFLAFAGGEEQAPVAVLGLAVGVDQFGEAVGEAGERPGSPTPRQ